MSYQINENDMNKLVMDGEYIHYRDEDIEKFCEMLGLSSHYRLEVVIKENPAERKKRLMRLEKEMLVDMVFNLESRNETLVNNLLEVERMYNDLKGGKENE